MGAPDEALVTAMGEVSVSFALLEMFLGRSGSGWNSEGRLREKRLRTRAREFGLDLVSASRDEGTTGGRSYVVIDRARYTLILGDPDSGFGISLDEAQRYLDQIGAARERLVVQSDSPAP